MSSHFPLARLAVLGTGLIGGSVARAAHRLRLCRELALYSRGEEREVVTAAGIADVVTEDPIEAVRQADLVVIALPIAAMGPVLRTVRDSLDSKAVVTDTASVKLPAMRLFQENLDGRVRWVGSHPMSGGERSGFSFARSNLFEGAVSILTPPENPDGEALALVETLWLSLGCRIVRLSALEHDRRVAAVSHLPHLLAAALIRSVDCDALDLAGPGFRDVTRIAAASPEMWQEILLANRENVLAALRSFLTHLDEASVSLQTETGAALKQFLLEASERRQSFEKFPS
ncbi:cyclohexadieny/prephenate dehydrogenase [Methylacidimicrobium cyclopophantes]|uniref:Cyclohexadieny/prephenate dehydrogenase n=1 Tax=Methylacidimicrobium cyclopophantes TaxID=1041766 RepID=A0A5E6MHS4_9BACT|nr:prephenate dehydrogenase/arogenate dehydrogenase family protein [Methylacidimicrobium cyclopophantes]VVM05046.1 cyclohexadieny/prephenate dehydrogenase [Methylacidimicrobium cyclopophantes]